MKNPYRAPDVPQPPKVPECTEPRKCFCVEDYTCAWHRYGQDRGTTPLPEVKYDTVAL